jgi:dipeptidyl aminopeptidase/acylaminoacyl peptidase
VPRRIPYGPSPEQVGDLWLPGATGGPPPVVAIWHGGGYVPEVDRTIMEGVARDLCERGVAAWNLEYRRVGSGGGWPQTFADAADGLDRLADLDHEIDLDRVVALGFSAGAPLALWAAGRGDAAVRPVAAISQAGLTDLEAVAGSEIESSGLVRALLGAPDDNPEPYALANPIANLPLGVPQLLVHGDADENIPLALTERFVERARAAGDDAELVVIPGATHFDHNDPGSEAWAAAAGWLERVTAR